MQKIAITLLLFFALPQKRCFAQISRQIDSLCIVCSKKSSDSDRVISLGRLADYYFYFKLNEKADSVLREQLLVAEMSNNSNLILSALFDDAILNIGTSATSESFDKTINFIQKGIDYAKLTDQYDYIALGYNRMSEILRQRGDYDMALKSSLSAFSASQNVSSDSIKALLYLSLGAIHKERGDAVDASANYNRAYDIAVRLGSIFLQSKVHHALSEMYKDLDDSTQAKQELDKSLLLNKQSNNGEGLVVDYFDLSRLTDEKLFIAKAIQLADSLKLYKYSLSARRALLTYYFVVEHDKNKAIYYLEHEPDLKQSYLNAGIEKYYETLGNIYVYTNEPDSALYYQKLALPFFEKNFDPQPRQYIYEQIALAYSLKNDRPMAINFFLKALDISKRINTIYTAEYLHNLSDLYAKENDFKNAYMYAKEATNYKDSSKKLSRDRDITLMKVNRENRKHEAELMQQQKIENSTRNIQYMAITIVIVIVFFIMLLIGTFPVSKLTVRMMGYFFFISLFEFIVLLIDNLFLTHVVHNQPLKLWLIKIVLIGMLAPFQHFLEKNLIGLLASRKLVVARSKISIKKWWPKLKKPAKLNEEGLEKDTAVL